jgi:putative nucleotidyltransferase-like protein
VVSRSRRVEDELLLLLVHGRESPAPGSRLAALLGASPDWAAFLRQADLHGVVPLVAHHLQRLGSPDVPRPVRDELQRRALLYGRHSLLLVAQLRQVLGHLAAAGIPVIPLKGVALSSALYRRPTLRVSTDIDVLVPRERVPHAVEVLEGHGYKAEGPWRRWAASAYHVELPLLPRSPRRRYPLDLHWGLGAGDPRDTLAAEECWATARTVTVAGVEARAMSPEWELLFLALHAARSQWQGLKWLVDIQEICWTWRLDWDGVRVIARRWGWERVLALTLEACRCLWGLPPPNAVESVPWPRWLPRFPDPPRESRWASLRVTCLLLPRWRQRAGHALRLIGTSSPNDYRWLPLPAALFPLYVFLRPVRWAAMGGKWCLRTVLPRRGA